MSDRQNVSTDGILPLIRKRSSGSNINEERTEREANGADISGFGRIAKVKSRVINKSSTKQIIRALKKKTRKEKIKLTLNKVPPLRMNDRKHTKMSSTKLIHSSSDIPKMLLTCRSLATFQNSTERDTFFSKNILSSREEDSLSNFSLERPKSSVKFISKRSLARLNSPFNCTVSSTRTGILKKPSEPLTDKLDTNRGDSQYKNTAENPVTAKKSARISVESLEKEEEPITPKEKKGAIQRKNNITLKPKKPRVKRPKKPKRYDNLTMQTFSVFIQNDPIPESESSSESGDILGLKEQTEEPKKKTEKAEKQKTVEVIQVIDQEKLAKIRKTVTFLPAMPKKKQRHHGSKTSRRTKLTRFSKNPTLKGDSDDTDMREFFREKIRDYFKLIASEDNISFYKEENPNFQLDKAESLTIAVDKYSDYRHKLSGKLGELVGDVGSSTNIFQEENLEDITDNLFAESEQGMQYYAETLSQRKLDHFQGSAKKKDNFTTTFVEWMATSLHLIDETKKNIKHPKLIYDNSSLVQYPFIRNSLDNLFEFSDEYYKGNLVSFTTQKGETLIENFTIQQHKPKKSLAKRIRQSRKNIRDITKMTNTDILFESFAFKGRENLNEMGIEPSNSESDEDSDFVLSSFLTSKLSFNVAKLEEQTILWPQAREDERLPSKSVCDE